MTEFGAKMFPGAGYPTPVSIPEETTCFLMQVPANAEWWALVVGVLYTLTLEYNWQQFEGGLEREDAAARWITMLDDAMDLAANSNQCSAEISAPYWDDGDADDADDQAPPDDQPWYGVLVGESTWQEQIEDWVIAAFVAFAATPAAAIAFLTIAPKFRLAFKQHDLGGIVRIFINASEVAQVDTYAPTPGVVTRDIVALPAGGMGAMDDANELWVVMSDEVNPAVTGDPNIQVILKRLSPDEVSPPNLRYDEDCNCIQETWDDGTTWHDQPGADPRHADVFRRPPRTDTDARCNAAQGMSDLIRHTLDNWIAAATLGQAVTGILEILLLLAGGAGVLIDLIILALETLATIGEATVEAAFTDSVYDDLTCAFYCNIDADGQMSADQLAAFLAQVSAEHPGTVYNVVATIANMTGEVLFSNAGAEGTETGDCSGCACNWCITVDLTDNDGGLTVYGAGQGVWTSGVGWQAADVFLGGVDRTLAQLVLDLGGTFDLSEIGMLFNWTGGTQTGGIQAKYLFTDNFAHDYGIQMVTTDETDETLIWTLNQSRSEVDFLLQCSINAHGGSATLKSITLRGSGDPPVLTGWTDCP